MPDDPDLRPILSLRVGLLGQRDLSGFDLDRVDQQIRGVLTRIKSALRPDPTWGYAKAPPECFLITMLAEGADQRAARIAVEPALGYKLRCPIPCDPEVYARSFGTDEARTQFRQLAKHPATALIVIETEQQQSLGHDAAMTVLLDNTDILVAILAPGAGRVEAKRAAEAVQRAEAARIPVVRIDPGNPAEARSGFWDEDGVWQEQALETQIQNILAPHRTTDETAGAEASKETPQRNGRERFFNEPSLQDAITIRRVLLRGYWCMTAPWWKVLDRLGKLGCKLENVLTGRRDPLNHEAYHATATPPGVPGEFCAIQAPYERRMEKADGLAIFYMEIYRGAFVMNFLLGAAAVWFALLSYFNPALKSLWLWCEISVLVLVALNFGFNHRWKWHERAIEYRFLAEQFRHMGVLSLLLRTIPRLRLPAHNRHGDPHATWMDWYFRAMVRQQGLVGAHTAAGVTSPEPLRLTRDDLSTVRDWLRIHWIEDQRDYHARLAHRFGVIHRSGRAIISGLFGVTILICVIHFSHSGKIHGQTSDAPSHSVAAVTPDPTPSPAHDVVWREEALFMILLAGLPALLASLHGIATQGEFERMVERSEAMAAYLNRTACRFGKLSPSFSLVSHTAVGIAGAMLEELIGWRVIYLPHVVELA